MITGVRVIASFHRWRQVLSGPNNDSTPRPSITLPGHVSFHLRRNGLVKPERRNVKLPAPVAFFSSFLFFFSFFIRNWITIGITIISNECNNFLRQVIFEVSGYRRFWSYVSLNKRRNIWNDCCFSIIKKRTSKLTNCEFTRTVYLKKRRRIHFQQSSTRQEYAWRRKGCDREQGREATRIGRSKKQPGRAAIFLNTS